MTAGVAGFGPTQRINQRGAMSSKLEYLQRYMGKGGETAEKKLRKKRKKDKSEGTRIVDADHDWTQEAPARGDLEERWGMDAAEDEAPVIVANGEVDPEDLPVIANADEYEAELKANSEPKRADGDDLSPPRRQRDVAPDDDASPPRRRSVKSDDTSPPRRGRTATRSDDDASPPRRSARRAGRDSDTSPPRPGRRGSEDASPPRRRRGSRTSDDESPPRRRPTRPDSDDDLSPPRRTTQTKSDNASPPRRTDRKADRNSSRARSRDPSPARRSPQRRQKNRSRSRGRRSHKQSRSNSRGRRGRSSPSRSRERSRMSRRGQSRSRSPVHSRRRRRSSSPRDRRSRGRSASRDAQVRHGYRRRRSRSASASAGPPRRRRTSGRRDDSSSPRKPETKSSREAKEDKAESTKTARKQDEPAKDEYKPRAGLFTAEEFADDLKRKAAQNDMLRGASAEDMGQKAETVYRDKKGRKLDMLNELVRQQEVLEGKRDREAKEEYEWGTGRVQKEEKRNEQEYMKKMKDAPFARRADDADLEVMRRERVRAFDPINSKVFQEDNLFDSSGSKKSKKLKSKKQKSKGSSKPKYAGPPAPPNRFSIQPGYRWDGVVRGTGWEEKIMLRANTQNAQSDEAYRYAVADM